jgi:aryl-alcohol dehydrogenase-like predicted oxidoreductase
VFRSAKAASKSALSESARAAAVGLDNPIKLALGQQEFTRQLRYAFDNGINFFDLADQYGSHPFFTKSDERRGA